MDDKAWARVEALTGIAGFGDRAARLGRISPYTVISLPGAVLLFVWVIGTSLVMFRRAST